ncbi:Ig-like domain-containing protein [Kitasatospora sp. NPDC059327]|uniref:Ig-like domain-containing protein n=1 Tax=Kitasatospora sp. NPDC059327 TaxID=3346803 RepID=UPI0036980FFD
MTLVQTVNQASVTTTLASSANPAAFGQPVTFTDTVCPAPPSTNPTLPPSGTVTFRDGSTLLGTGTLAPGGGAHCAQATLTWSNLAPGTHTITASYGGDGNYLAGPLESLTQTVTCTRTVTGTVGTVLATTGSTCVLNATVNGPVLVQPGAALFVSDSTVATGIDSRGATQFGVCGSRITGAVNVAETTGGSIRISVDTLIKGVTDELADGSPDRVGS